MCDAQGRFQAEPDARDFRGLGPNNYAGASRVFEAERGNIEAQIELLSRAKIFDMACKFGIENLSTSLNRSHALE